MSTHKTLAVTALVAVVFAFVQSCANDSLPEEDAFACSSFREVSFDADIQPIIDTKCAIAGDGGCHNGGNGPSLDWRVFANFQSHAASVKDRVTRPAGSTGYMPKLGSLTNDQIKLLVCWVDQGAKDN